MHKNPASLLTRISGLWTKPTSVRKTMIYLLPHQVHVGADFISLNPRDHTAGHALRCWFPRWVSLRTSTSRRISDLLVSSHGFPHENSHGWAIPIRWLSYVKNHLNSPEFRHDAENIQLKELKQFSTMPSGYKSQFTIR